jgi:hypothetical protein
VTRDSDHLDMSQHFDERATDALLAGRNVPGEEALSAFVAEMLAVANGAAPTPSVALADLLEHGLVPDTAQLPTLLTPARRRWLLPIPLAAAALAAAAGVFGAATANALPAPAQRIVSDTVDTLTPLHLPKPASKPKPAVSPTPESEPSEDPTHATYLPTEQSESPEPAETSERPGTTDDGDRVNEQGDDRDRGRDSSESRSTSPTDTAPTDTAPSTAPTGDRDETHDGDGRDTGGEEQDRSGPADNGPGGDERG